MLTIQRKTGFNGITYSFLRNGKLIAAHVPGLLLSQAIAKLYGSSLPVSIIYSDGTEKEDHVVMRNVVKIDPMQEAEAFVDMCIMLETGNAFAEVPLISLRDKYQPENRAVRRVSVRYNEKLELFLIEKRDEIERQSLYEMLCESELREVRHVMKFLDIQIRGGEELEDHVDEIVDKDRKYWEERYVANELKFDPQVPFTTLAHEAIAFMENKNLVDQSLTFEDEAEEEFDFEEENEIFTDEFDGDNIEEDLTGSEEELDEDN